MYSHTCARDEDDGNRLRVYVVQFSTGSSRNLLPLAGGMLVSYALAQPDLAQRFRFELDIVRSAPEDAARRYVTPRVVAFSLYSWNLCQSLTVAALIKTRHPESCIVVGGPSAPVSEADTVRFFAEHPAIDAVIAGEGELRFAALLRTIAYEQPLEAVAGISTRSASGLVRYQRKDSYLGDLTVLPSPFLDGVFDSMMLRHRHEITGAVIETNRGCPFRCTFCSWGALGSTVAKFPLDRTFAELDWISRQGIRYIYWGDANFGMLKRDYEIARHVARLNRDTGFPKVLVLNWTKNKPAGVLEIAHELAQSNLQFMLTASAQSFHEPTLRAVRRENIAVQDLPSIAAIAKSRNVQTYSEMILGLPLETYESFVDGIRKLLLPELHSHFYIYCCVIIPGAEMAAPEYRDRYSIETRRCVMNMPRAVHRETGVAEYEEVVVGTSVMPIADWRRAHTFGYFAKCLHGFRLAFFPLNLLRDRFHLDPAACIERIIRIARSEPAAFPVVTRMLEICDELQAQILNGGSSLYRASEVDDALYPDVAMLLAATAEKRLFYRELNTLLRAATASVQFTELEETAFREAFVYQYLRQPDWSAEPRRAAHFQLETPGGLAGNSPSDTRRPHTLRPAASAFRTPAAFLESCVHRGMMMTLLDIEELSLATDLAYCKETCSADALYFSEICGGTSLPATSGKSARSNIKIRSPQSTPKSSANDRPA